MSIFELCILSFESNYLINNLIFNIITMMYDITVLDKEAPTTGKNLSDSIVEKYAFVFQSCDVDMKLLVENKVSHYPASDVL